MTDADIDALADRVGLVPRKCRAVGRGRCMCGHLHGVHERLSDNVRDGRGRCEGSHGRCRCEWFVPYDYAKEHAARMRKLRAFARAVLAHERGSDGDVEVPAHEVVEEGEQPA